MNNFIVIIFLLISGIIIGIDSFSVMMVRGSQVEKIDYKKVVDLELSPTTSINSHI